MNSRNRDVAQDLSNSKYLVTTALLYAGKKKGEAEHKHQSKTENWPSESSSFEP